MEKGTFVPRFRAWCDRDGEVDVDFRLGRRDNGQIVVAVRKAGAKKPHFVPLDDLEEVPLGRLAITRQLHGER